MDKRESSENPARKRPRYSYEDHLRYANEKIKSMESLSEEQTRRFKDGAVKIISQIYSDHTGLAVDISKPPPIAMDLSCAVKNTGASTSRENPSTSFDQPESSTRPRKSLRPHSDQYLTGSTSDDVMIAKKSYASLSKYRTHDSKTHSSSYTSTSTSSCQGSKSTVPPVTPAYTFPILQETQPTPPRWYVLPPSSTNVPDTVNLDSDDE